jgi:mannosyltransferase OCH1-like enzyme
MFILCLFINFIIVIIFYLYITCPFNTKKEHHLNFDEGVRHEPKHTHFLQHPSKIPKVIVLTIKDKSKIPKYIIDQYQHFARSYKLLVFDDEDCKEFLKKEYGFEYLQRFEEIELGAHKADFFRYAYLYKYGGVYFDVKTILLKNLTDILQDYYDNFYMVYTFTSYPNGSPMIYNGVIATYPKNKVMYDVLQTIFHQKDLSNYYRILIDTTEIIREQITDKQIKLGVNELQSNGRLTIFKEDIKPRNECKRLDRWGFCTFISDSNNENLFRTRDPDYTPNYE